MKAIVLSGGGSKGSYQIGAWKALKKLKIKYDIITGTSVGAINGSLMVQNSYYKALKLWKKINARALFGNDIREPNNNKELFKLYSSNFFKNGGMDVTKLQNIIDNCTNIKKFYNSNIDFGLITFNVSERKAIKLRKEQIPSDKLTDYLMASSSCYPAFKFKKIDGKKYVDGGYYDNLPINLAIDMGADEVIAIDLSAPGFKKKLKKDINIIKIKPNNKLVNFLNFNKSDTKRNIKLGYNDTMKVFKKLSGKKYTFRNKNFTMVKDEYKEVFLHTLNKIIKYQELNKIIKIEKLNIDQLLLRVCEQLGSDFKFDETKIYKFGSFNKKLLKKANYLQKKDSSINKTIFLYNKLINNDLKYIKTKGLLNLKDLIKALYLYTLKEV